MKNIIEFKNVSYIYMPGTPFEKVALNNINLEIQKNEFVGVMGHTGSGKTTFAQMLNGILKPASGTVIIDEVDITNKNTKTKDLCFKVGLVMQFPEYQLFEETVHKDISFGPKNMGLNDIQINLRVERAIKFVGLDEKILSKSPFELSGGQKRRVAIAGVIAMEPKILVLDEPTAGLDPLARDEILNQIKFLKDETQTTVIFVSHSMEEISKFCEKVIVMNNGKIVLNEKLQDIFSKTEFLESIGLSVPQITKIVNGLKKNGMNLNNKIYEIPQIAQEIKKNLKKSEG
ncbi:MAG: energy-coupling factor transporter ATPase [Clostridiales bacterium]|jgi:energy-coupling factor transport system ATP-binding protein|nr:energy-coupling factor transporter ATPase [Clostridiales bacterium]